MGQHRTMEEKDGEMSRRVQTIISLLLLTALASSHTHTHTSLGKQILCIRHPYRAACERESEIMCVWWQRSSGRQGAENRGVNGNNGSDTRGKDGGQEERRGREISDVLVLVLALIPPNVPGIEGGVHPFSLTLTIALGEAMEIQSWQRLSGPAPAVHLHIIRRRTCFIAAYFTLSAVLTFTPPLLLSPPTHTYSLSF